MPVGYPACSLDSAEEPERRVGRIVIAVLAGTLVVSLTVVLAVAGLFVVRRLVPLPLRESHNAATGILFGALYVMYGVMVGFAVFLVANQYDVAQKTVESEAGNVEEIYRLAGGLPQPERHEIRNLTESYGRAVVEEGWPLMEQGRLSPRAEKLSNDLREKVVALDPGTAGEQAIYSQVLTLVQQLGENRHLRLLEAREGIPFILWFVLIVGGITTVALTYLFGMKTFWLHVLTVAALAMIIALILYTIHALEFPFDGVVKVDPEAFEIVLQGIEEDRGR